MNGFTFRSLQFLFLFALLTGCGPNGPRTYRIPGKLVYNDGSPVPGASVVLQTKVEGQTISARGMAAPDGKFVLTTFKQDDGVVAGEHQVAVSPLPAPDGAKPVAPPVPIKYWDFGSSGMKTSVAPDTKEIVITLDRNAK